MGLCGRERMDISYLLLVVVLCSNLVIQFMTTETQAIGFFSNLEVEEIITWRVAEEEKKKDVQLWVDYLSCHVTLRQTEQTQTFQLIHHRIYNN